jgi:hypothetical protein
MNSEELRQMDEEKEIKILNERDLYEMKLEKANKYLQEKIGLDWDDLPDINSLHDAETDAEIHELCDERIFEDFDSNDLDVPDEDEE